MQLCALKMLGNKITQGLQKRITNSSNIDLIEIISSTSGGLFSLPPAFSPPLSPLFWRALGKQVFQGASTKSPAAPCRLSQQKLSQVTQFYSKIEMKGMEMKSNMTSQLKQVCSLVRIVDCNALHQSIRQVYIETLNVPVFLTLHNASQNSIVPSLLSGGKTDMSVPRKIRIMRACANDAIINWSVARADFQDRIALIKH